MRILYYFWILSAIIASGLFGSMVASIFQKRSFWISALLYAISGFGLPVIVSGFKIITETIASAWIFIATVSAISFPVIEIIVRLLLSRRASR